MISLFRLLTLAALVVAPPLANADLPDPTDAWTEFPSALEAQSAGWFTTCGLSQLLVVGADCTCGVTSVGVRATQARWQNRFGLQTTAPLGDAVALRFEHKATWTGLDVLPWNLFLTMDVTAAEAAAGYDLKQLRFTFDKAEAWTRVQLDFEDGVWEWRSSSSGMWMPNAVGGTTELTTLVSVEWYLNAFLGIAIGDEMRIDELTLVENPTAGPALLPSGSALRIFPNPCKAMPTLACRPGEPGNARLTIFDARGRLVRRLETGWLPAAWSQLVWDGRDAMGRSVGAGVYRVVLEASGAKTVGSVSIVR